MKLRVKKGDNIIAENVKLANNPITRLIGLLTKSSLNKGEGILITPCNGVHSFFMRFNFDAIYLDKKNNIVYLEEDVKPWRVLPIIKGVESVLEIQKNSISEFNLKISNELEILNDKK